MKSLVLFYSTYGHTYMLAKAVAEGASQISRSEVEMRRVPETLPDSVLKAIGAVEPQMQFSNIPECKIEELPLYDAIFFGTPTRFGNMIGQMRMFLDSTGPLWAKGALVGKVGSVFTSSSTQHGGQESTLERLNRKQSDSCTLYKKH